MSKSKTIFYCSNCGAQSPKWIGKCPSCETWNSYQEEIRIESQNESPLRSTWKSNHSDTKTKHAIRLDQIEIGQLKRTDTTDPELNRVLGGGLVNGSVTLLAGQPGIGKSTLLLQIAMSLKTGISLYVSGEESEEQISMRANRLKKTSQRCFLLPETRLDYILAEATVLKPELLIIDSIQTLSSPLLESAPGTVSQIRDYFYF